ncbi:MAG: hypothetical protein H0X51_07405 [Parachlamydiaceae bacterium]|nr:hypothetical protein [Parachlamydiaceae bacterium]
MEVSSNNPTMGTSSLSSVGTSAPVTADSASATHALGGLSQTRAPELSKEDKISRLKENIEGKNDILKGLAVAGVVVGVLLGLAISAKLGPMIGILGFIAGGGAIGAFVTRSVQKDKELELNKLLGF